jgi:hypothetical protein
MTSIDPTRPGEVFVQDLEAADQEILVRPHWFIRERLVLAVVWGGDDTGGSVACAIDADGVCELLDALLAWLDYRDAA